jgi:acyl-CoA thioester hydrolase
MAVTRFKNLKHFLQKFAVISPITVQWGDMDAFKHVNNTVYFKYQEASRLRMFRALTDEIAPGAATMDVEAFHEGSGVGPILSDTYVKFIFPLMADDNLLVGAHIHEPDLGADRFKISHAIWSLRHNRVVASGFGTVVSFDYAKQKVEPFPKDIVDAVRTLGKKDSTHLLGTHDFLFSIPGDDDDSATRS